MGGSSEQGGDGGRYLHEGLLLKEKPADYYRTTADRYRKLLAETTTPRLTQYLGEMIARCEALARLALECSRLGAEGHDDDLLSVAERSANEAKELMSVLPGHPQWGSQADAALACVWLARRRVSGVSRRPSYR